MSPPILLYDGFCGLCNRLVHFVLQHDRAFIFRFAALQSSFAGRVLARYGVSPADLDSVYVVLNYDASGRKPDKEDQATEILLTRFDAVLVILQQLGGIWRVAAFLLRILPRPLRDLAYRIVARNRYRVFGRYNTCPLPSEETRGRFLAL
jgi:predicted DCC family thiol-disulfide oxidoreductase YuxK